MRATSFLAGAAFAGDEHGDIAGSDALDEREDVLHLLGRADERAEDALFAQLAAGEVELLLGLALARGVGQDHLEARGIDRLLDEVIGAELHGLDGAIDGALRGKQDDALLVLRARRGD